MRRTKNESIHDWATWEALCLKHGQDPWAVGELVTDYTYDDYSTVTFRGERPARPADHDDAPAFLTAECIYCQEPGWAADMTNLPGGAKAHPECRRAALEHQRTVERLGL